MRPSNEEMQELEARYKELYLNQFLINGGIEPDRFMPEIRVSWSHSKQKIVVTHSYSLHVNFELDPEHLLTDQLLTNLYIKPTQLCLKEEMGRTAGVLHGPL